MGLGLGLGLWLDARLECLGVRGEGCDREELHVVTREGVALVRVRVRIRVRVKVRVRVWVRLWVRVKVRVVALAPRVPPVTIARRTRADVGVGAW